MTEIVVVEGLETELIEKIEKVREKDGEVVKIIEEMKIVGVKALRENEWEIEEDLVLKEGKMYIPKNEKLRTEVIWLHHDVLVAEYGGR